MGGDGCCSRSGYSGSHSGSGNVSDPSLTLASMFESGDFEGVAMDTDVCVAGILGVLARDAYRENIERARIVESVCEVVEFRLVDAERRYGDPSDAHREALCEIATALNISLDVARKLVGVAERLNWMPLTAIRFVCGTLDYTKVLVLTSMLSKASEDTIRAIEHQCVAAAERLNPRSLRKRIWHLWMRFDEDEATRAQHESTKLDARVSIDPKDHGMAQLTAHMTDLQGAEAEQLISEIADTVCKNDPRSRPQLRVDGLLALLHGEHALECTCSTGADCPAAGLADGQPPRRGHLLQIMIGVETLLGLTAEPASLPDGIALNPEVVRTLAGDARWQAILTELVTVLEASRSPETPDNPGNTAEPEPAPDEPGTPTTPGGVPLALMRVLGRGRSGPAAVLPDFSCVAPIGTPPAMLPDETALSRYAAVLSAMVEQNPSHPGVFPDGHGGLLVPPAAGLVYRPNTVTSALVRMAYRCCAFPGCEVPAERCELDHIVPFDHGSPEAGGWTIASNLQPLCTCHHQAKTARMWTAVMHAHGAIVWTSRAGIVRITLPEFALPTTVHPVRRSKRVPAIDHTEETWWEKNIPEGQDPPTITEQRAATANEARGRIRKIRRRFREHKAILRIREQHQPPPF